VKRFRTFDTTNEADMVYYETNVLNNELCTVLDKEIFVKKEKFFNEEGIPTHSSDTPLLMVHWEEKVI